MNQRVLSRAIYVASLLGVTVAAQAGTPRRPVSSGASATHWQERK